MWTIFFQIKKNKKNVKKNYEVTYTIHGLKII